MGNWEIVSVDWLKDKEVVFVTDCRNVYRADCRILVNTHLSGGYNDLKIIHKVSGLPIKENEMYLINPNSPTFFSHIAEIVGRSLKENALPTLAESVRYLNIRFGGRYELGVLKSVITNLINHSNCNIEGHSYTICEEDGQSVVKFQY